MGKRSRKRASETGSELPGSGSSRAERDAARRERAREARRSPAAREPAPRPGRTSIADRPKPLWHPFPFTEIVTLGGIGLMTWGFLSGGGSQANKRVVAGLALASIAGLELAVREHVTGFRSHTTLLAGAVGILTIVVLGLGAGLQTLGVLLLAGVASFAASFYGLRVLFKRRSGGLSFR
jgi:hypothetical protein